VFKANNILLGWGQGVGEWGRLAQGIGGWRPGEPGRYLDGFTQVKVTLDNVLMVLAVTTSRGPIKTLKHALSLFAQSAATQSSTQPAPGAHSILLRTRVPCPFYMNHIFYTTPRPLYPLRCSSYLVCR
jgi:hypothetical protein